VRLLQAPRAAGIELPRGAAANRVRRAQRGNAGSCISRAKPLEAAAGARRAKDERAPVARNTAPAARDGDGTAPSRARTGLVLLSPVRRREAGEHDALEENLRPAAAQARPRRLGELVMGRGRGVQDLPALPPGGRAKTKGCSGRTAQLRSEPGKGIIARGKGYPGVGGTYWSCSRGQADETTPRGPEVGREGNGGGGVGWGGVGWGAGCAFLGALAPMSVSESCSDTKTPEISPVGPSTLVTAMAMAPSDTV
jgi:hypothetical protein